MSDNHELRIRRGEDPEAVATRWITKGWHGAAIVKRTQGPGKDLYGPHLGRWSGHVSPRQWVTVTVRPPYGEVAAASLKASRGHPEGSTCRGDDYYLVDDNGERTRDGDRPVCCACGEDLAL